MKHIHFIGYHIKTGEREYQYFHNVPEKEKNRFADFLRSLGYLIEFEQGKIIAK